MGRADRDFVSKASFHSSKSPPFFTRWGRIGEGANGSGGGRCIGRGARGDVSRTTAPAADEARMRMES
eukprot:72760-Pleurochrysis_carterae.AAC.3